MDKRAWFVLEIETGLIDGWYFLFSGQEEVLKSWRDARPGYTHIVATTIMDCDSIVIECHRTLNHAGAIPLEDIVIVH